MHDIAAGPVQFPHRLHTTLTLNRIEGIFTYLPVKPYALTGRVDGIDTSFMVYFGYACFGRRWRQQ